MAKNDGNIYAPETFVLKTGTKKSIKKSSIVNNTNKQNSLNNIRNNNSGTSSILDDAFKIDPTLTEPTFDEFKDCLPELNSNHIYKRSQIQKFDKFSRFGFFDPYNSSSVTREYIFFTKMDLHLFEKNTQNLNPEISNIPFFRNCYTTHRNTMNQLQWSTRYVTNYSPFCNLLTNSVASALDLQDISIDKLETAANIKGTKLEYPLPTVTSNNTQEFSLEFKDNKFLDVYMFFRIWYEYELLKLNGTVTPPDDSYIYNKILHDQMSAYKIIVGEDMETIIHWSKLWGVYPLTIPRSAFSDVSDDGIKLSVSFTAQWVEDMDPNILSDFNAVVSNQLKKYSKDIPIYNDDIGMVNGKWCNVPYIAYDELHNRKVYKLKWR